MFDVWCIFSDNKSDINKRSTLVPFLNQITINLYNIQGVHLKTFHICPIRC